MGPPVKSFLVDVILSWSACAVGFALGSAPLTRPHVSSIPKGGQRMQHLVPGTTVLDGQHVSCRRRQKGLCLAAWDL